MKYDRDDKESDQHEEDHGVSDSPTFYSPPLTARERKVPSPFAVSPVHSVVSSDQTSLSHGLSSGEDDHPSPLPGNISGKPASPAPVLANRSYRPEPIVVTKKNMEDEDVRYVEEGNKFVGEGSGGGGGGGGGEGGRRLRPNLSILKKTRIDKIRKRFTMGFRICEFKLCLMSLAVMAVDKNKGWALDSFYRYKEFRYCLAVNVIGFVYSGLQLCDIFYHMSTRKAAIHNNLRLYFDFFMDQILAYCLLSASSSAATRVYDWQLNWGKDKFPTIAGASVGLSVVAFVAFSLSSIVSGYSLCKSV